MSSPANLEHVTCIIPTRCRPDTLEKCLRTVIAQNFDALSVVVSDNASGDHTEDVVKSAKDSRVSYFNTGRRVSMSANYEFALSQVKRQNTWVTILGDDDGLLPGALRRLQEMLSGTKARALRSTVCAYSWPSLTGASFGRLGVPLGSEIERRNCAEFIARVMNGRAPYSDLPMLYNGGFVHFSVIDAIRSRLGNFYHSLNPDVFSAFAIASVVDEYVYSAEPLAINGLSAHSTGMGYSGQGNAAAAGRLFRSEANLPFHPDIPLCEDGDVPLGQPLVYESFLQTAALRPSEREKPHRRQLELALATSPIARAERMDFWARAFAKKHALDFDAAKAAAAKERQWLKLRSGVETVRAATRIYVLGSPELPVRDVHEASVVAGTVRSTVHGPMGNVPRLARLAAARFQRWLT